MSDDPNYMPYPSFSWSNLVIRKLDISDTRDAVYQCFMILQWQLQPLLSQDPNTPEYIEKPLHLTMLTLANKLANGFACRSIF